MLSTWTVRSNSPPLRHVSDQWTISVRFCVHITDMTPEKPSTAKLMFTAVVLFAKLAILLTTFDDYDALREGQHE